VRRTASSPSPQSRAKQPPGRRDGASPRVEKAPRMATVTPKLRACSRGVGDRADRADDGQKRCNPRCVGSVRPCCGGSVMRPKLVKAADARPRPRLKDDMRWLAPYWGASSKAAGRCVFRASNTCAWRQGAAAAATPRASLRDSGKVDACRSRCGADRARIPVFFFLTTRPSRASAAAAPKLRHRRGHTSPHAAQPASALGAFEELEARARTAAERANTSASGSCAGLDAHPNRSHATALLELQARGAKRAQAASGVGGELRRRGRRTGRDRACLAGPTKCGARRPELARRSRQVNLVPEDRSSTHSAEAVRPPPPAFARCRRRAGANLRVPSASGWRASPRRQSVRKSGDHAGGGGRNAHDIRATTPKKVAA